MLNTSGIQEISDIFLTAYISWELLLSVLLTFFYNKGYAMLVS